MAPLAKVKPFGITRVVITSTSSATPRVRKALEKALGESFLVVSVEVVRAKIVVFNAVAQCEL